MCGKYYADREFIPHLSTLFKDVGILPDPELREEWERVLLEDDDPDMSCGSDHDQILDVNPTDRAVVISLSESGLVASKMKWGFKDPYHESLVINARSESAAEKPMFSESVREHRCVIPASGYYEWDRSKSRYRFTRPDGGLVLLAGIYRQEIMTDKLGDPQDNEGQRATEPHFTILTAPANECMKAVHTRMPVTVDPGEIKTWIMDRNRTDELLGRDQMELLRVQDSGQIALDLGL